MDKDSASFIDLLTSGSIMKEVLYGLIKSDPDDQDSVLFSDAFSRRPGQYVICHWVSIPKSLIAQTQPLGVGYCCASLGLPVPPYHYVRLMLKKPQDKVGAAIAELLSNAFQKLGGSSSCSCESADLLRVSCGDARDWVKKNFSDYDWGDCEYRLAVDALAYANTVCRAKMVERHGSQGSISADIRTINHGSPAPNTFMPYAGWNG